MIQELSLWSTINKKKERKKEKEKNWEEEEKKTLTIHQENISKAKHPCPFTDSYNLKVDYHTDYEGRLAYRLTTIQFQ